MRYLLSLVFLTCFFCSVAAYEFVNEPIDVIIPSTAKDQQTLDLCIDGVRKYCANVRRIIVISKKKMTDQAEWFDERKYPFNKQQVALQLNQGNKPDAKNFLKPPSRVGWYFQQLLKLYAHYVIPDLSSNVLVVDSDTIFLNPVEFTDANGEALYNPGLEYYLPYYAHAARFLPEIGRVYPEYSGISHHMLFQKAVLDDLFARVEAHQRKPLWQAFCRCVARSELNLSGASEYEIYFNFVFSQTDRVHLRFLKWKNLSSVNNLDDYKDQGYHYVSCHVHLRKDS